MIFPGKVVVPDVDDIGKFHSNPIELFSPNLRNGMPTDITVSQLLEQQIKSEEQWSTLPQGFDDGLGVYGEIFAQNQKDCFGLLLQKSGLVGDGTIAEGIGGLTSGFGRYSDLGEQLQKQMGIEGLGLGTAREQLTQFFPAGAVSLATDLISNALSSFRNLSGDPGAMTQQILNTVLGGAAAVLMMTPSPFGVTQILGMIVSAANAISQAFTVSDAPKVSQRVMIARSFERDIVACNDIKKGAFQGSDANRVIVYREGLSPDQIRTLNGIDHDFHNIFDPPWPSWKCDKNWKGYEQVSDRQKRKNIGVEFSARRPNWNKKGEPSNSVGFIPGAQRRTEVLQASYLGVYDNRGDVRRLGFHPDEQIKSLSQLRCEPKKDNRKTEHCVPFRNLGSIDGWQKPDANDTGSFYPATNQVCGQIWSTMVNRPGPAMYAVDAEVLADKWRRYFESFWECAHRWWSDDKAHGWRATILKICSLMTCEWDDVSCSWVMRDAYTPGRDSDYVSALWLHDPRDKNLKLPWSSSAYELIIRPACINLAKRQYEFLHTSAIAYLPENAAAYSNPKTTMGKAFREMRRHMARSSLKQYISLADVTDPDYRRALGSSAGQKAGPETNNIFGIVHGLSIPEAKQSAGGIPNSNGVSDQIAQFTLNSARKYGTSHPDVVRHLNLIEECEGRGPDAQALRTAYEGMMLFDLMQR